MKEFIEQISDELGTKRRDLVEKDMILHRLLLDLSGDEFFSKNFLFKGGTCLIKCYLGYYRFSEDIDFTWESQEIFEGMSQKRIRVYLSKVINRIGLIFEDIARRRDLEFRCEKENMEYVELGGGNKFVTFKLWYRSEITGNIAFIKVQINFVEKLCFPFRKGKIRSLLTGKTLEELKKLFPEDYGEYSRSIDFDVYDTREILCEKVRSILTRRGIKSRDFVDVYLICKNFDITPEGLEGIITEKVGFMLQLYEKYRRNIAEKRNVLGREGFAWGEEKELLLIEIDTEEFYDFLDRFFPFLNRIMDEVERVYA